MLEFHSPAPPRRGDRPRVVWGRVPSLAIAFAALLAPTPGVAAPDDPPPSDVPAGDDVGAGDETAKDESAKDESAKDESAKDESAKDESAKDESANESAKGEKKKKKKKEKPALAVTDPDLGTLVVGGRVFSRAQLMSREQALVNSEGMLEDRTIRSLDLSIPSARVKVEYQSSLEWLSAEVEAEFSGRPELKDGFVQAKNKMLWLRAGQFKMPFSVITMESPWRLPIVDRGLIHDFVNDVLQVGGRAPGVAGRVRLRDGVRPELTLGAFQGSVLVDPASGDADLAEERFLPSQHFVARAGMRLGDLDLAANYQHRMGTRIPFERETHWTAGADAYLDLDLPRGGVRAWVEGVAGESWVEHPSKSADDELTTFVLARAIAAPRFGGVEDRDRYLEPFVGVSLLEPDAGGVVRDFAWEFVVGVNVGYWQLVRLGVEAQVVRADSNFPAAYLPGENPDRQAILAQLGINF